MLFPTVTVDRLGAVIGMHALYQWRELCLHSEVCTTLPGLRFDLKSEY